MSNRIIQRILTSFTVGSVAYGIVVATACCALAQASADAPPTTPPVSITSQALEAPDYPAISIRLQEQGQVGVKYLVNVDGTVGDCQVIMSSGKMRLDAAACAFVIKKWKFRPATTNSQPVATYSTATVNFSLR